jgi:hypothetical protein
VSVNDLCPECRHIWGIHHPEHCRGWSRRDYPMLWLPLGFRVQLLRWCRCRWAWKPLPEQVEKAGPLRVKP